MSVPDPTQLPEVAIGHHPDHGIVAALPTQSPAAQWMLERLDFQRVPGHPSLYALTDQQREAFERTAWAIKLLTGAGYRVDTDMSLAPESPSEQAQAHPRLDAAGPSLQAAEPDPDPGVQPQHADPDFAFAEHPGSAS
ncbi:hypothetical protein AB0K51_01985 [Kitasatospora sp. NPDC049285]|uniref:hypothetical protein n=1 Tax=Kitasatospora sp. NPDC049285 TaxID=3157096 RepID=UPI0034327C66